MPLGGGQAQTTNARIIAATNVDLFEQVKRGTFREDLYYRLQVLTIHLPPLRQRKEDLPDLIQTLLTRSNREMRRKVTRIALDVMDALHQYDWPGNVRELENTLMKAVALCPGDMISRDLIPLVITGGQDGSGEDERPVSQLSLDEVEKAHVARVLKETGWHRGNACGILGVSRPRLRRMIRQYDLTPPPGVEADDGAPLTEESQGDHQDT